MDKATQSTNASINDIKVSVKDVMMIVTVLASIMGSYFTISYQIKELASKFDDYKMSQERIWKTEKELITLQIRTLEIKVDRLEQNLQK